MPLKPYEIFFPTKGWDTNNVRLAQPDGTSPALRNIMPFDRWNRRRGGTRFGTSKITNPALGTGGQQIQLLQQVTRALDPTQINPSATLLTEAFNYSNGELNTVSAGAWILKNNESVFSGSVSTDFNVSSGQITFTSGGSARLLQSLTLGVAYIIKLTVTVSDFAHSWLARIAFRGNTSNLNDGVLLEIARNGTSADISLKKFNLLTTYGATVTMAGVVTAGTPFVLELRVSGNVCYGFIDGVQKLGPITVADFATNTVVGFTANANGATLHFDDYEVFAGDPLASYRETSIVTVCGGSVYTGNLTEMALASSGSGVLTQTNKPQMAASAGLCWFVDGSHFVQLDLATKSITAYVISAGSETTDTLKLYTLACVWRDRLVLAASIEFPQNFIMSRQGDHTDWDYGQVDAAAAVAGNASKAGAIGEPLNALMPFSDDVLILGGDHSVYKVEGDIAAGGQILLISDSVGTLGADAWDGDSQGNLYFVGTGGLYKLAQGSTQLENLSKGKLRDFFTKIDRVRQYVTVTWDSDRQGLHIHVTDVNAPATDPTHLFWDIDEGAFFPYVFPANHGPITALVFDGDAADDRVLLIGGRDGHIRKLDPTVLTDDGTTISSYCYIGPIIPYGDQTLGTLQNLDYVAGDYGDNSGDGVASSALKAKITVQVGQDAFNALYNSRSFTISSISGMGRRKPLLQRITGNAFYFKVESDGSGKVLSLEKLIANIIPAGMVRRF